MGSADPVDSRTFNGNFSEEGAEKLKEIVKDKLKEYMGDYTDDTLVEYVIVLLRNGRRKEEANNELKIFLGDDSESFVTWLWDRLAESLDKYFNSQDSLVEKSTIRNSSIRSQNVDEEPMYLDSESQKGRSDKLHGARRCRWISHPINAPDKTPLVSSEVHKIGYEKEHHKPRHDKRSPSPQLGSHRKRCRTDDCQNEKREAKNDVSRRLLQFAVRDALATSKPPNCSTDPSLKRLRSVVSASNGDICEPDPARKTRSLARVTNPMATVIKAVAEAAEDTKKTKYGRSVFDRISHSSSFSETLDQHILPRNVSLENEQYGDFRENKKSVQHQFTHSPDNDGVFFENRATFDTSLHPIFSSDHGRSVDISQPSIFCGNSIHNPKSLQHLVVGDPKRAKRTNYQNHLTEVATRHKTASFSGNLDTGKQPEYEEQMEVTDMGLQRYLEEGRLVSSEAITQSSTVKVLTTTVGNGIQIKPAANAKEDLKMKSVPGTASATRPLEDANSRTIFVANVHFGATKDSLSRHFNKFGEVLKAGIVTDLATGQPTGSAYIEFTQKEAAENALSLDGTSFMSRILKIVKGSNGQPEAGSSMTWSRGERGSPYAAARFTRASYRRGSPGAFRGRPVARVVGARSMQWKRESAGADTGNDIVAPNVRSLTYVRTEPKSDGNAPVDR